MRELSQLLSLHGARISFEVVNQMYRNPFWKARFGDRGRRFAEEDGRFHVQYLVQALEARDAAPLTSYARWVQGVLTSRGMCTRHLADNLRLLGMALQAEGYPEIGEAQDYLDQAVRALRYSVPEAGEVQDRAEELAGSAVETLLTAHPDWAPLPTSKDRCRDDALYHLSYLADAIASAQPALFSSYGVWIAGFLEGFGVPRAHTTAMLDALSQAAGSLSPKAASAARRVLEAGLSRLREEAA